MRANKLICFLFLLIQHLAKRKHAIHISLVNEWKNYED